MQKISVTLATYNEKENIRMCLDSVKDWADEIVIVDGTSSDNTAAIAEKEYKARVIVKPNQKNFHINKQIGIDACKFPWILQLDADEVVSMALKHEIEKILDSDSKPSTMNHEPSTINGYWMPRKNWFLGRFLMKGGQYPDYTLRLYRNGKGRLPQKDVHEQAEVSGEVGYLAHALLHYPYKDFTFYLKKWNRYNIFAASLIKQEMHNASFGKRAKTFIMEMIVKPIWWFLWTYGRHKGFMDLWPGFVFCLFSSLRFPVSYIIYVRDGILG